MRILFLRGGALGDFIVTLPALQAVRRRWPSAYVALVGNVRAAELAILTGELDAAYSQHEARWAKLFSSERLPSDLLAWLDQFDWVINCWPDPSGAMTRHFAHRQATYVSHPSSAIYTRPAAQHFFHALSKLGIALDDYSARLKMPPGPKLEARERLKGLNEFIAVHPGSGSRAKNWPNDRWIEVISKLKQPVLLIQGEAESNYPHFPASVRIHEARDWPLPVLAAALTDCVLFIGHDSGISHLAAATGALCLLLFGPTDPGIWAPVGFPTDPKAKPVSREQIQVLRPTENLADISVKDVLTAAAQLGAT